MENNAYECLKCDYIGLEDEFTDTECDGDIIGTCPKCNTNTILYETILKGKEMTINTTGVVSNENNKITEAGTYVLKIVKVEEDGFEKYKLSFEGKKALEGGKLSDETYSMLDWLQLSENLIWKVARIRDALKSPEVFDLDDWVGRYVVAVIEMNTYNEKTNPQFKQLKYSTFNDSMTPIPEAKSEQSVDAGVESPTIDITEDKIPF